MKLSIIIVHYKNKEDVLECLESLYRFKPKFPFEIIVVDNSERKVIKGQLGKYKNLRYQHYL